MEPSTLVVVERSRYTDISLQMLYDAIFPSDFRNISRMRVFSAVLAELYNWREISTIWSC